MSDSISLTDLLDLSIGTPHRGAVNFSALHALLQAVLGQLGMRDTKTRWRDSSVDAPVGLPAQEQDRHADELQPGAELQERASSCSPPGPPAEDPLRLWSRIQSCEDGVSKAMSLLQELHEQNVSLREETKELCDQQKTVNAVEMCCHRVDILDNTVRSLRDTVQRYPDPEELSQFVTWDVLQSSLLSERENLQKVLLNSGVVDPAEVISVTLAPAKNSEPSQPDTPSSPHPVPISPSPPSVSAQISTLWEDPLPRKSSGSELYAETVEALRNISKLEERVSQLEARLEARLTALEDRKVEQSQLDHLRELVTNKVSQDASSDLTEQLNQQRALIDGLMSDQEKLDTLEEMFMSLSSPDRETSSEAAPGTVDSDSKASQELRPQIFFLRNLVQKLEEDVKQLKAKQASTAERAADRHLQDQLDDLRGMLEDMMVSLTSELSGGPWDKSDGRAQVKDRSAFTAGTVSVGRTLSRLFGHYERLQDTVNSLVQQQTGDTAGLLKDTESVELVNDVQSAILQLQAECEKLHETTRCLHEDNRQKQSHIEELYKTTEELEEKKADKQMVESEIKADKSALESKVSRLQFDSVTEQLNAMFHELLNKVTGQEQDWHKVIDRLSTEMECKLNRIELDSVKKQLEGRWKNIHEKLQAQGAPEHEDAAGLRKQLVDRFHCLSCDRPVVKYSPGPHSVKLPSTPGFPSHKSIRPFTVYALEQFRQHFKSRKPGTNRLNFEAASWRREQLQRRHAAMCRQIENMQRQLKRCDGPGSCSAADGPVQNQPEQTRVQHDRVSELADCGHLAVLRSCGGSHTVTLAGQRRSGLQYSKHYTQTEADGGAQSEEVDIVGLDGHIYKGRLNAAALRNTETKLPTISNKDGVCKTKDRAKVALSHRPAASPETGHGAQFQHPHSTRSGPCSRSASSSSGRDWPVSALGCTSQSSVAQPLDGE